MRIFYAIDFYVSLLFVSVSPFEPNKVKKKTVRQQASNGRWQTVQDQLTHIAFGAMI